MSNLIGIILFFVLLSISAQTPGELNVSVTTSETGGKYAPKNVLAIWIENNSGEFIKTLMVYGDKRKTHLNTWQDATLDANSEYNDMDAITGATRSSHGTRNCTWDGTDFNGSQVADGEYKILMELTDKNETGNHSSFSLTKGSDPFSSTPGNAPSFSSINIEWAPENQVVAKKLNQNIIIQIYPNPGTGIYFIEGSNIEFIEVRNITGALVTRSSENWVDLRNQPRGIYLFKISNKDYSIIRKIVKD